MYVFPTHVSFRFEAFSMRLLLFCDGWVADSVVKHGYTAEMPKVSGEAHH